MNWGKFKRIIEREFKRNPAKTGVLLALLPVAVYFIGPLLWKMLPSGGASSRGVVALTPATGPGGDIAAPAMPAAIGKTVAWYEIAAAMDNDSRMSPSPSKGLQNPFRNEEIEAALTKQEQKEIEETPPVEEDVYRPEDFGLQLTATIVGSRFRLATINGKQYRENATVTVRDSDDARRNDATAANAPSFVVKTVDKKFVVLERKGKLYQLRLAR